MYRAMIFNRDDSTGGADRCWWRVCDTDLRRLIAPEHSSATTLMLSLIVSELASLALGDSKVPLRCLDPERVHLEILNVIRCEKCGLEETFAAFTVRVSYHSILNASLSQLTFRLSTTAV